MAFPGTDFQVVWSAICANSKLTGLTVLIPKFGVAPEVTEDCSGEKAHKGSTLALKPRADVTRSPKQGCQWPHDKDLCPTKRRKSLMTQFSRKILHFSKTLLDILVLKVLIGST